MNPRGTAAVAALLDRYLLGLDDDKLDDDWVRSLFTADATVEFPMSRHSGLAGMAGWHRDALAAFRSTQHLGSPAVVTLAGDRATLRANLQSTHVHRPENEPTCGNLFATGTFVTGEARRETGAGWRLSRLSFRVLWMSGSPPPR